MGIPNTKTGTLMTAVMHVFTAVVGAGVLNLPYAVSWLGWIAGPLLITAFFVFSLLSSVMLGQCFEVNGVEHERYHHLVNHLLGRRKAILASVFQLLNIFLVMWAYSITGGGSIVAIAQVACEYSGADLDSSQCFAPSRPGVCGSPR
jgi:amino acid permease